MKKSLLSIVCTLLLFGLTTAQNTIKGFGDSNTQYGFGLPNEKNWLYLVGKELNLTVQNYASAGATISSYNGLIVQKTKMSEGSKDYAVFMFGTNDAYKNEVNTSWKTTYKSYIQEFITAGYDKSKLFIISPNYDPSDADGSAYLNQVALATQFVKEISSELGINYVGLYEEMKFQFHHPNDLSVYFRPVWWLVGGKHLNFNGHRLLADIFKKELFPPQYEGGTERVKLFGAGSAMAGISSYHHSFVQLFGVETKRQPKNYAIAGTGVAHLNMTEVNSGTKDIILLLYGNNDGNGTESWKNLYKSKLQDIIAAGYQPQNIVLFTVTIAPNLERDDLHNWNRIKAANVSIRQLASELGVKLIDTEQLFINTLLWSDNYHINDAANEILAEKLKALFPAGSNAGCLTPPTPTITASGATTFCQGGSVILTSSASSGNQWFKNGAEIAGATATTLQITEGGNYSVRVSNSACSATSSAVTVIVNSQATTPSISASGATTFCSGGNVTLTSSVSGTLQWYKNNTLIPGATAQSFTATETGSYTVMSGTNGCTATSAPVSVTVSAGIQTPTITASGATTFCQGGSVTLTSSAQNGNQWFKDGAEIQNANQPTLNVTETGSYLVKVSNGSCTATSTALSVSVNAANSTPIISASGPTTICEGSSVSLNTNASGSLQWYKDGVALNGATTQTYNANSSGSYTVTSGTGACAATSAATSVTVNNLMNTPTITASGATTFCQGGSVILTSSASSGNQWFKNGAEIAGATATTLQITEGGNYSVRVSNSACSATSSAVTVTVNSQATTPSISASGATTFCSGGNVTLTSSVSGTLQWFKNNTLIPGATAQSFTATETGSYTVMSGTNGCTATSAPVSVTVNAGIQTPTITASGATTFCQGGSVTLTSSAQNGNQWFKDGAALNGATNKTININASGSYTVQVNINGCTSNISNNTNVTVNAIPEVPTISANGNELTSSANSGNQWFFNGSLIHGASDKKHMALVSGSYTVKVTSNGCSAVSEPFKYTAPVTTSADSTLSATTLNLFPNPFSNKLNVVNKTNHRLEVRVINMQGMIMLSSILAPGTHNIDTYKLTGGSYILSVTDTYTLKSINKVMIKQ